MESLDKSLQAVLGACADLEQERFEPGAVLISEGPSTSRMFILVRGEVEVLRGEVQVAEVHEPGAIFGEMSALLDIRHSASVRAVTEVVVYRIDDAGQFLQKNTEIVFHVARILARRLFDATSYLVDIKQQYSDRTDHLALVDEVLDSLVQRQRPALAAGSDLKSDPRL